MKRERYGKENERKEWQKRKTEKREQKMARFSMINGISGQFEHGKHGTMKMLY